VTNIAVDRQYSTTSQIVMTNPNSFMEAFDNPRGNLQDSETPVRSGSDACMPQFTGMALEKIIDESDHSRSKSTPSRSKSTHSSHNDSFSKKSLPKPLGIGS
jgi:hypothetical protein